MIKYIILDFGKVLAYPTTGDWFITPLFLKLIDMSKIDRKKVVEIMNSYSEILSRKLITLEEEYNMYYDFYKNVFNDIKYDVSEDVIKELAHDITYNDDKYRFYKEIDEELDELSKKYTLILLSDNWPCAFHIMKNRGIDKYFDKLYISSIYQEVKKDGIFFDRVINDYNIKNGEAIFVDDNESLLDVAITKGLEVRLMDREKDIKKSKYKIINNLKEKSLI